MSTASITLSNTSQKSEQQQCCEDNYSSSSSCASASISIQTARPLHDKVHSPHCNVSPSQEPLMSKAGKGMSETKRRANTENVITLSQSNSKKRRVSFCVSTKPPSDLKKTQRTLGTIPSLPDIVMKHSASCTSLPNLTSSDSSIDATSIAGTVELDLTVSPAAFVKTIVLQSSGIPGSLRGADILSASSRRVADGSYFLAYTDEHLQAYTADSVTAVQCNDVEALRALHRSGHSMQASNRFGESVLHTACRRGFADVVRFLVNEVNVSPRVRDDMGRTPMHDACWSSAAPNHDIMRTLVAAAPELLLSRDKRGHSPFDYARREYWPNWVGFLNEHRGLIMDSLVSSCVEGSERVTADGLGNGCDGDEGFICTDDGVAHQRQGC